MKFFQALAITGVFTAGWSGFAPYVHAQQTGAAPQLDLTFKQSPRLEIGTDITTFHSSENQPVLSSIEVAPGNFETFVVFPSSQQNSTIVLGSVRYAHPLSERFELFGSASGQWREDQQEDIDDLSGFRNDGDFSFRSLRLGANWIAIKEQLAPGVVITGQATPLEKNSSTYDSLKSASVGVTVYRTLAPVVISLSGSFGYERERKIDGLDVDPSESFTLIPSVTFNVNDAVSLYGATRLRIAGSDRIEGEDATLKERSLSGRIGGTIGLTPNLSVQGELESCFCDGNQTTLGLNLTVQF